MRDRSLLFLGGAAAVAAIGVLALVGWPASDYKRGDFVMFYVGGRLLLEGRSPYDIAWWTEYLRSEPSASFPTLNGEIVATAYPLWTLILVAPFGLLPLRIAAATWLVAQVFAVAVSLVVLVRSLGLERDRPSCRFLMLLVGASEAFWFLIIGGNVTGFVFAAFALSTAAAIGARYRLAGALLALVIAKPQSFIVTPLAALAALPPAARARFVAGAALVALPLVAATFALQPGWPAEWPAAASAMQSASGSNATGWTLGREIAPWVPVASIGAVLVAFVAWWRVRRPPLADAIAAAVPVSIFVSPYGWSHEHLYLLVPATIVLSRLSPLSAAHRAIAMSTLFIALVVLPWTMLVIPRYGEHLLALVPLCCLAVVVWASSAALRDERESRSAPAAVAD